MLATSVCTLLQAVYKDLVILTEALTCKNIATHLLTQPIYDYIYVPHSQVTNETACV